ncbi:hypothetical protein N0U25_09355 [Pseudomonas sivasensis]|uniref:hypothetical protein n=1 Tax=Pseudomonas sivasensis TaxID=1880678 RepID=UPI0021AB0265|nr:hypothetical protein [Pseudomonas sivasensis]MCT4497997.1 hypothetical protein [Pseudomonas sivasensis]
MQALSSNVIAGLFLTQMMYRLQLHHASWEMRTAEKTEFDRYLETGEFSEPHQLVVNGALNTTIAVMVEQFGVLQATQLTRGLFNPSVLRVIIQHIMTNADQFDWEEVGRAIPQIAGQYKIDQLINPLLARPLSVHSADYVRKDLEGSIKLFDLAWHEFYRSTDADYSYASLWVKHLADPATLIKKLYEAGVQRRDDESSPVAVENLLGTDSGEFEAFCVYHSLGETMASAWEHEREVYGHETYKGAVNRAISLSQSSERDALFASAIAAGYPVQGLGSKQDEFADLILKIPGYIHNQERELVNHLIHATAPLLYLAIADDRRHKASKWRGMGISADFNQTQSILEDTVDGSGWMPLVRLRIQHYANRNVDTRFQGTPPSPSNAQELITTARENTTCPVSALRITYLVDQICEIIEHDFFETGCLH